MSEQLKEELARELGVYDTVHREGWGAVSSRDCGRLVQLAIARAEQAIAGER
ncbi:MAG TPA: small, acid-soluble spore protein, alpha/beta type [Firmicutes bacterium]|jgi:small acid-soluble spore protein F (minor alpha/beta-type SASP)|nr:small, acid-soluble spore protein, alpha/beta type [Bacillota bacterium]